MYIIGLLFKLSIIYMKQILYNIFYYYVILENMSKNLLNKYFYQKVYLYKFNNNTITTVYNDDFSSKVYILNKIDIDYTTLDFFNKNIFISIVLENENNIEEITKEISYFFQKNINLTLDYDFAILINDFLKLNLDINKNNYKWKIIDNNFKNIEENKIKFTIDEDYNINYL